MNLERRRFLKTAGVSLALPWLDCLLPRSRAGETARAVPRRMVCICTPLGLHPPHFFPEQAGKSYTLTPYLELLQDYRDDFTVISGLSHVGMSPGFAHQASVSFLTGVPDAGRPGFRNAISLDVLCETAATARPVAAAGPHFVSSRQSARRSART